MPLDRSRPYGVIHGVFEEVPDARYIQDGRYFTGAGDDVGPQTAVKPVAETIAPRRGRPPKVVAEPAADGAPAEDAQAPAEVDVASQVAAQIGADY